ncbi:hypothetical protein EST38_g12309 [Candolleomyces aberdarensis]|uniref:Uncharacterized protein n=1 Tax=Candolleomyces aberdarensis TaxID=2316362 RepID=A0A4Q2D5U6_9AGAR|nr:hypothetical protein EST38_g12309 [Candolleomyces aberdarensis]
MPNIRPGWTPKQSVYLRLAAIEFLRVSLAGHETNEYLNAFFEEWVATYGNPTVREGSTLEAAMALHKTRVITTIRWYAFRGGNGPGKSKMARIHKLKHCLERDLYYLWDLPEDYSKSAARGGPVS